MAKLRILPADDHATVREGVKMIINAQQDMEVVAEAADGRRAVSETQAVKSGCRAARFREFPN
jgi:two-component system, NarL family, response regulator NreC